MSNGKPEPPKKELWTIVDIIIVLFGLMVAVLGILIFFDKTKDEGGVAFKYFSLAILILVLKNILPLFNNATRLKFGDLLELERKVDEKVEQKVTEVKQDLEIKQAATVLGVGGKEVPSPTEATSETTETETDSTVSKNTEVSDPQKKRWGEKSEYNNRRLTAKVTAIPGSDTLFRIYLEVTSTNPAKTLTGTVTFHLHPTFRNPTPTVVVNNGVASLTLVAWGAFTVGAQADNGETHLELDLADPQQVPDAPEVFRLR